MKRTRMSSGVPTISVLTPTIPERETMLNECRQSVIVQNLGDGLRRDFEHLIWIDQEKQGCAKTMNALAAEAHGEWLLPLADDDLLLPGALHHLISASVGFDVVYPRPLVWGEDDRQFGLEPPIIPSLALIRAELWRELNGYNPALTGEEDRDFWTRALEHGAKFVCFDTAPTWVYRFWGGNKSRNNGVAS